MEQLFQDTFTCSSVRITLKWTSKEYGLTVGIVLIWTMGGFCKHGNESHGIFKAEKYYYVVKEHSISGDSLIAS
jgi:hypothetical protein